MAYQNVDSKKDEFRKYLDKAGVVSALTTGNSSKTSGLNWCSAGQFV
jgi:hypothetical protein